MTLHASSAVLAAFAAVALVHGPAAAQTQITGSGRQATLECRGGTVAVTGARNDLHIRGPCRKVAVTGAGNTVLIDSVAAIAISGTLNQVTWREGLNGRAPRISRTGAGNTVAFAGGPRPAQAASAPGRAADAVSRDAPAGAGTIELLSDGGRRTLDCEGRSVSLMGSRNSLTLRGRCPVVNVSGDANQLTVETPDAILVTGDRNEVAWSGVRSPRVTNTGQQNRIGPERP